jgi:hypothetical protein
MVQHVTAKHKRNSLHILPRRLPKREDGAELLQPKPRLFGDEATFQSSRAMFSLTALECKGAAIDLQSLQVQTRDTCSVPYVKYSNKRVLRTFISSRKHSDWCRASGHTGEFHHVDPILEEEGSDDTLFQQNWAPMHFDVTIKSHHSAPSAVREDTTDRMRRLTTGIRSEKCVVRRFRHCANVHLYRVIPSVLDPRKCEYLKDYSLDFE